MKQMSKLEELVEKYNEHAVGLRQTAELLSDHKSKLVPVGTKRWQLGTYYLDVSDVRSTQFLKYTIKEEKKEFKEFTTQEGYDVYLSGRFKAEIRIGCLKFGIKELMSAVGPLLRNDRTSVDNYSASRNGIVYKCAGHGGCLNWNDCEAIYSELERCGY